MTEAEAEAVALALRILHQGGPPQNGLLWVNSVCQTHRFALARRGRAYTIEAEPLAEPEAEA